MRAVLRWLFKRAGLYLLLVLALALAPLAVSAIRSGDLRSELMSPRSAVEAWRGLQADAADAFGAKQAQIALYPPAAIEARHRQAQAELAGVRTKLQARPGWFTTMRPSAVLARKQLDLQEAALGGELRLLEAARSRQALNAELSRLRPPTASALAAAKQACDAANLAARRFNERDALDRSLRNALAGEARQLTADARRRCGEHRLQLAARQQADRLAAELARAQAAYLTAGVETREAMSRVEFRIEGTVRSLLLRAALLLLTIIAVPYLIRLVFYFVLAPLAERRRSVQLPWPAGDGPLPFTRASTSATSAPITLRSGEELLVRQGFLQSTSSRGSKATKALLDWRHPLSSLASGLAFLTRIRGAGETTTVSATDDPFAEVALLDIPPGGACVLHPRALVAVAQPIGRPLRITSHWRLTSLHAWLTLQLRYLMFHGPARLVIKGARGVRLERARRGRVFSQAQLVGFSDRLAYSVTRTETFWPYFVGIEPLLKDKVEAGDGLLILEEAPGVASGGAGRRRGLEGAADALLKLVGL